MPEDVHRNYNINLDTAFKFKASWNRQQTYKQ